MPERLLPTATMLNVSQHADINGGTTILKLYPPWLLPVQSRNVQSMYPFTLFLLPIEVIHLLKKVMRVRVAAVDKKAYSAARAGDLSTAAFGDHFYCRSGTGSTLTRGLCTRVCFRCLIQLMVLSSPLSPVSVPDNY
jgi:hypothetical protein